MNNTTMLTALPNIDPDNGVAYGVIRLNDLNPALAGEVWENSVDVDYDDALAKWGRQYALDEGWIDDSDNLTFSDVGVKGAPDPDDYSSDDEWEEAIEAFVLKVGHPSDSFMEWDDWLEEYRSGWQCLFPEDGESSRQGEYDDTQYMMHLLGGAWTVFITESPFIAPLREAGPCAPNAHNISRADAIEPLLLMGAEESSSIQDKGYTIPPDWWVTEEEEVL